MDRVPTRILVRVAAKYGENPYRRRGKGSLAMFVSQGLVDPKVSHKLSWSKGKQVNIPVHSEYTVTFGLISDALRYVL